MRIDFAVRVPCRAVRVFSGPITSTGMALIRDLFFSNGFPRKLMSIRPKGFFALLVSL